MSDAAYPPISCDERPIKSYKKTARWCGGHVGREHMPIRVPHKFDFPGYQKKCDVCGKNLESVLFFLGRWNRWRG